jgi:hypothetical protein
MSDNNKGGGGSPNNEGGVPPTSNTGEGGTRAEWAPHLPTAAALSALVILEDRDNALQIADGNRLAVAVAETWASVLWAVWQRNDPDGWPYVVEHLSHELQRLAAATRGPS